MHPLYFNAIVLGKYVSMYLGGKIFYPNKEIKTSYRNPAGILWESWWKSCSTITNLYHLHIL